MYQQLLTWHPLRWAAAHKTNWDCLHAVMTTQAVHLCAAIALKYA